MFCLISEVGGGHIAAVIGPQIVEPPILPKEVWGRGGDSDGKGPISEPLQERLVSQVDQWTVSTHV